MLMSFLWPEKTDAQLLLVEDEEKAYECVAAYVKRLMCGEPIQYVIGNTEFCDLDIYVEPGVLIPRPETELLINILTEQFEWDDGSRFLDIGTGSGCIALALKSRCRKSVVEAWDISPEALSIARGNAHRAGLDIEFRQVDVLDKTQVSDTFKTYDLIVSNPPYISESESKDMDRNVLEFEPSIALFVPDSDPLVFYRTIAEISAHRLNSGGVLGFEINPLFVNELIEMLNAFGFNEVIPYKDQFDKVRFITGIWRQ